jgi:nucleobase:cation symporter-1, NCS1 family
MADTTTEAGGGAGAGPGVLTLEAPESSEGYALGQLEERGIELIPESERPMKPSGLFLLWAGAIWNVEFVVYGALMLYIGLSFWQAVAAILIGNLMYALLGFASLAGPETGTTAFMVSRAPFGRNGNRLPSIFNWITQVGFEVEGIALVVLFVIAMFEHEHGTVDAAGKALIIILAVAVQFIMPFLGHATIQKILRYLAFVFVVVFIIMAILVIPHAHLSSIKPIKDSWWIWTTGLVIIVSTGGLGWTENAADYSRYLPKDTPKMKTFLAAGFGGAIPSILLELLGVAAFMVSSSVAVSATDLPASFTAHDSWFFWPFVILALPQLFSINTLDMYSSGVTLQAIGIPIKRWGCIIIDTIVSGGITALVIYKGNFLTDLSSFLDYIVVWLGPWFGILMVDYLLRRGQYSRVSLAAKSGGIYWRNGGFNWKALFSLGAGMFAAMMWIDALYYKPSYTGPLSNATHGADLSWIFGLLVSAIVYYALSFRSVQSETAEAHRELSSPHVQQSPVQSPMSPGGDVAST